MRAVGGLRRRRHTPLRRTTDLVEAWPGLTALPLILCVAPVAGTVVVGMAQDSLQRSVRGQHASRHLVTATLVREPDRSAPAVDPETTAAGDPRSRVLAGWTDRQGRRVPRPLGSPTAATHAVLAGSGAALVTAAVVETARRIVLWRMVLRRYARLDRAWHRAGGDRGLTGAGS
ncbi:hypothetical protein ACLGIH_30810 [Streptomyces sp. HMX87]|uniref:hypothetical protein n=1 Tax=Streptomyces sp. HMX87 TaxID=3390849 RepID=UPI003A839123